MFALMYYEINYRSDEHTFKVIGVSESKDLLWDKALIKMASDLELLDNEYVFDFCSYSDKEFITYNEEDEYGICYSISEVEDYDKCIDNSLLKDKKLKLL